METLTTDRRMKLATAGAIRYPSDMTTTVQQGLLVQAGLGTVGAVEYLKAHDIGAAVIERVLTSADVRDADRCYLKQQSFE